jgi:hypothetical protein
MTARDLPTAEALEAADWMLVFFIGTRTWAHQDNRNTVATRIQDAAEILAARRVAEALAAPIPMILFCPNCGWQHVDAPSPGWDNPPHKSHLCHACAHIWRPADVATVGVVEIETIGSGDTASIIRGPIRPAAEARRAALEDIRQRFNRLWNARAEEDDQTGFNAALMAGMTEMFNEAIAALIDAPPARAK